jgi:hypothetical protein
VPGFASPQARHRFGGLTKGFAERVEVARVLSKPRGQTINLPVKPEEDEQEIPRRLHDRDAKAGHANRRLPRPGLCAAVLVSASSRAHAVKGTTWAAAGRRGARQRRASGMRGL